MRSLLVPFFTKGSRDVPSLEGSRVLVSDRHPALETARLSDLIFIIIIMSFI